MPKDSSQEDADNIPNSADAPTRVAASSQPDLSKVSDAPTRMIDSDRGVGSGKKVTSKATSREQAARNHSARSSSSYDSIDDARFVPGEMLAERYRIVGLLGKGGMGEVYRADDLKLGQAGAEAVGGKQWAVCSRGG